MDHFVEFLINNSMLGYSLCGEKPVSMETFPALSKLPIQYAVKIFLKDYGYSILWNGWKTWERYSHLFPSKKFVIRFIPNYNTIILINKKATLNIIEENIDLFRKYSNTNQNAIEFLDEICFPREREYLIKFNTILLGILLGYGRNNAIAFNNKSYFQKLDEFHMCNYLDKIMDPGFIIINNGTNELENSRVKKLLKKQKKIFKHRLMVEIILSILSIY